MTVQTYKLTKRNFELARSVDDFVVELQRGYEWRLPTEGKLIRDAVHGYQLLAPHEVATLDSPLIQRLRRIHQTALAYYVYPTATHTRFDHSLGVAKTVESMFLGLGAAEPRLSPSSRQRVRLAALLHDSGHVLFSHLGEDILSPFFQAQLQEAQREGGDALADKKLGEVLSYLLVTSPTFADGLDDVLRCSQLDDVTVDRIAPLLIGKSRDKELQYEGDMISGPFDTDKLDYLLRDCHFSGIRSTVDVERIYYTARILRARTLPNYLAIHVSGVPILEQLLMAKLMLFTAVYHHQKVRALECTLRGIVERMLENRDAIRNPALKPNSIADWLNLSEDALIVYGLDEPALRESVRNLVNRRPLRRALVISRDTVKADDRRNAFQLRMARESRQELLEMRRQIHEEMKSSLRGDLSDLWVDFPQMPRLTRDVEQVAVTPDGKTYTSLSSPEFQWTNWAANYAEVKWRGHVFCRDDDEVRQEAGRAAQVVFSDRYGIELKPSAMRLAKNP